MTSLARLLRRIIALELENADLRRQLAEVQAHSAPVSAPAPEPRRVLTFDPARIAALRAETDEVQARLHVTD